MKKSGMVTKFDWLLQIKHRLTYVGDEFAWGFQSNQEFLISALKNHRLAKILRPLLIQIYYWVRGRDRRKLRQEGGVCNDHPLRVHSVDSNLECKYASTWLFRNSLFIKRWLFPFKSNDPQLRATVHWIKHRVTFVGVQSVREVSNWTVYLLGMQRHLRLAHS